MPTVEETGVTADQLPAEIEALLEEAGPSAAPPESVPPATSPAVVEPPLDEEAERRALYTLLSKMTEHQADAWHQADAEADDIYVNVLQSHYGFTRDTIKKLKIGWDDGTFAYLTFGAGYSRAELLKTGHFFGEPNENKPLRSTMSKRIVFPYLDDAGNTIYEAARQTSHTAPWIKEGRDATPKYVKSRIPSDDNGVSPLLKNPIYVAPGSTKGKHAIGLIPEGMPDAISCIQAGWPVVSPITTRFSAREVPALLDLTLGWDRIVLVPDQEANGAGMAGATETADIFFAAGRDVRIAILPFADIKKEGERTAQEEREARIAKGLDPTTVAVEWKIDANEFLSGKAERKRAREHLAGLHEATGGVPTQEAAAELDAAYASVRGIRRRLEMDFKAIIESAPPYLQFRIDSIPTPIDPSAVTEVVTPITKLIAARPDPVERGTWIDRLSGKLGGGQKRSLQKAVAEAVMEAHRERLKQLPADGAAAHNFTDLGNAQLLLARLKGKVRYVTEWKSFVAWSGKVWVADPEGRAVRHLAAEMVCEELRRASEIDDPDTRAALVGHWLRSESRVALSAMRDLLADAPDVRVSASDLDAKPDLFNCANGTLDLEAQGGPRLRRHDPADLLTKMTSVAYNKDADCHELRRALEGSFPDDPEIPAYLQRSFGRCLSGHVGENTFEVHWGKGGTGRSTLFAAVAYVLGPYASKSPRSLFETQKGGDGHPADLATLRGIRLAYGAEIKPNLDIDRIKELTGKDALTARGMGEDFYTFIPTHRLMEFTNGLPIIEAPPDDGIFGRLALIPWRVVFRGTNGDVKDLDERLRDEAEGILTWLVEGFVEYKEIGLCPPKSVQAATLSYREESDDFARFIADTCEVGAEFSDIPEALWLARHAWTETNDKETHKKERKNVFLRELTKRGFPSIVDGKRLRVGIRVRVVEHMSVEDALDAGTSHEDETAMRLEDV